MGGEIKAITTHYKGYKFRSRLEARWAVFFDAMGIKYEYEKEGYDLGNGVKYLPDFWLTDLEFFVEIKGQDLTPGEIEKVGLLAAKSENYVNVFIGQPWPGEYRIRAFEHRHPTPELVYYIEKMVDNRDFWLINNIETHFDSYYWGHINASINKHMEREVVRPHGYPTPYREQNERILTVCPVCHEIDFGYAEHVEVVDAVIYQQDTTNGDTVFITGKREHTWEKLLRECENCGDETMTSDTDPFLLEAYDAARSARFEHGETPKP